jgi:preprotein translocase subunit SecE
LKVTWPTSQEVMQTTLVVGVMIGISSLLLWGVDSVVLRLIKVLAGQKG